MLIMMMMSLISIMIPFMMITLASIISKKTFSDREKSSPFECGFDPETSARLPFSLQFFLIAMIFLIFDVEITLILPFIFCSKTMNLMSYWILFIILILILLMGLYHEWNQGALTWAN